MYSVSLAFNFYREIVSNLLTLTNLYRYIRYLQNIKSTLRIISQSAFYVGKTYEININLVPSM